MPAKKGTTKTVRTETPAEPVSGARPSQPITAPSGSVAPSAGKRNAWWLWGLGLLVVLVAAEFTFMIKNNVSRQRELTPMGSIGGRDRGRAGHIWGSLLAETDAQGRLLAVDPDSAKVVVWNAKSGDLLFELDKTAAQNPDFVPADVSVAADGGIFVLDSRHALVYAFSAEGALLRSWPCQRAQALCVDAAGSVLISEHGNMTVERYDAAGQRLGAFGGAGSAKGRLMNPYRLTVDPAGNIYVLDTGNKRVSVFTSAGKFKLAFPVRFDLMALTDIQFYQDEIYLNDFNGGNIWIYGKSGKLAGQAKFAGPSTMALDAEGNLYSAGANGMGRFAFSQTK